MLEPCTLVLQEVWPEVLRCISRFEQVSQSGPSDTALFSQAGPEAASPGGGMAKFRRGFFSSGKPAKSEGAYLSQALTLSSIPYTLGAQL